jgi:cell division protease FtsH
MVTQWGMSEKLGPLQYEEQQGETFLGYSQTQRHNMSNETALLIDSEIKRLVEEGYERARTLLTKNKKQLTTLAEAMLEYESLTGEEIKALLDEGIQPDRSGIDHNKPAALATGGSSIPKTKRPGIGGAAAAGA